MGGEGQLNLNILASHASVPNALERMLDLS